MNQTLSNGLRCSSPQRRWIRHYLACRRIASFINWDNSKRTCTKRTCGIGRPKKNSRREYTGNKAVAELIYHTGVNNYSSSWIMKTALGDNGLICFGGPVSQTCLNAFVDYIYDHRRVASVGLHQINQCVDLADWIVGEIQRLVMDGITNTPG